MKRLLFLLCFLTTPVWAANDPPCVCAGAFVSNDQNTEPTPEPNQSLVTANLGPVPTPQAGTCVLADYDATSAVDCRIYNGTTLGIHIPLQNVDLPHITVTTQTTTPITASATEDTVILCDATAQNNVTNLPAAATAGSGRRIDIIKIDSTGHTCTVTPNGSEKINGQSTQVISAQYTSMPVITNGSNWFIQ